MVRRKRRNPEAERRLIQRLYQLRTRIEVIVKPIHSILPPKIDKELKTVRGQMVDAELLLDTAINTIDRIIEQRQVELDRL